MRLFTTHEQYVDICTVNIQNIHHLGVNMCAEVDMTASLDLKNKIQLGVKMNVTLKSHIPQRRKENSKKYLSEQVFALTSSIFLIVTRTICIIWNIYVCSGGHRKCIICRTFCFLSDFGTQHVQLVLNGTVPQR